MYAVYAFGCILGIVRMTNSDSTTRPKSPTFATVNLKKRNSSPSKNKQTTTQNPPQSAFKTAPQYIQKSDKKRRQSTPQKRWINVKLNC